MFLLTLIFLVLVAGGRMVKLTLVTSHFLPYLGILYSLIPMLIIVGQYLKTFFLNIMNITIPPKVSYPITHPSWVNKTFPSKEKKNTTTYLQELKHTGSSSLWSAYIKQCNSTLSLLHHLKKQFLIIYPSHPPLNLLKAYSKANPNNYMPSQ